MDEFLERLKNTNEADCVRMCFGWGQELSRQEGEILFAEIDKLREEVARLKKV